MESIYGAWMLGESAVHSEAMSGDAPRQLLEAISCALGPLAQVRAAILFGSQATGRATPQSDVDVAVLVDAKTAAKGDEPLREIIMALGRHVAADRLDVVILNTAPTALAFQVLKHGRVAFARDPADLHRFRVRTYSAHADYAHVERFYRAATKARARAGIQRG